MAPVLWRIICILAVLQLAHATQNPQKKIATPPPTGGKPLFAPEYASRPLRILAVLQISSFSHYLMSENLMLEMAKRGHQITMVSPFPPKNPIANFKHIDLSTVISNVVGATPFQKLAEGYKRRDAFSFAQLLADKSGPKTCRDVFGLPQVQAIINGGKQFDVLFTEIFASDCYLAIGHKLQIPTISMAPSYGISWMHEYTGDIENPSFVEHLLLEPTPKGLSSFVERVKNTYHYLMAKYSFEKVLTRPSEEVIHEFFGKDFPSLRELRNNVSLIIVNNHPGIFGAKPTVPRILPVMGIHMTPPKPEKIAKDVREWLESAPNGVVYFALGSAIQSNSIPEHIMKAFVGAIKEHKNLRFLWKFDATEAEAKAAGIPDNVKIAKWLPQNEILNHPKIVAFITHGGLMGTTEAIYHGVPMIGMGVFAEQLMNLVQYEKLGIAVRLDHNVLTKEDVANAITKVTSDASIRRRIKEVSQILRDQPMSPLDSAIWWTEYIVRHGGAPHLESPTARMPFWQYALLDVAAAALAVLLTLVCVLYLVVRSIFRFFTRTKPTPKTAPKRKKKD